MANSQSLQEGFRAKAGKPQLHAVSVMDVAVSPLLQQGTQKESYWHTVLENMLTMTM